MSKKAIVALTRGYTTTKEYSDLVERNKHIQRCLIDKSIPVILCHEGNIGIAHQEYIKKQTPILNIIFIDVCSVWRTEQWIQSNNIKFSKGSMGFGRGYRNMCSFWFVGFWDFFKDYDIILRIDEDCFVYSNIDKCFDDLGSNLFGYPFYADDADYVTEGLKDFVEKFVEKNNMPFSDGVVNKRLIPHPSGPYTNIMLLNLSELRKSNALQEFIKHVYDSNNIYIYRWGDLPLWGDALHYIFHNKRLLHLYNFKYYHKSHMAVIGNNSSTELEAHFRMVYEKSIWGAHEHIKDYGCSGAGSFLSYLSPSYIPYMRDFIANTASNKIVDIGCGDWQHSHEIYKDNDNINYYGYDTCSKICENNRERFSIKLSKSNYNFIFLDIVNNLDFIERGDICIIKDVLQHWSNKTILKVLDHLTEQRMFNYIVICNSCDQTEDWTDTEGTEDFNYNHRSLSANHFPLKKYNPSIALTFMCDGLKELSVIKCQNNL